MKQKTNTILIHIIIMIIIRTLPPPRVLDITSLPTHHHTTHYVTQVIEACDLVQDLAMLPAADHTEIGEKVSPPPPHPLPHPPPRWCYVISVSATTVNWTERL